MATETAEAPKRAQVKDERLDRIEAALVDLAVAVAGVSQAGRWAFNEHFDRDADGRVTLR